MTLTEVVMASGLLLGCLSGSLQLWGLVVEAGQAEERRQLLRERVEGELMANEARLRFHSRGRSPSADCAAHTPSLQSALADYPIPGGLRRQLVSLEAGQLLQVRVDADDLAEPRQRLWSPAAFGLCAAAAPPSPPASSPES
jgi:hypothetical protein